MQFRNESNLRWRTHLRFGLVVLIALTGFVDYWTGNEIDVSILYLIPIGIGAWCVGPWTGYALAVSSSIAWFLADLYGGYHYTSATIPYWNTAVGLAFFLIIAAMLAARKRAERRIYELMNVKSEFTSMVSHEVRTPLTCIKEGIDIVLDGGSGPLDPRHHEHLRTAKRNVDRLARLLNDVLTYQKLEAHRTELFLEPCDLNQLVSQAAEDFALPAEKKRLQLVKDLAPGLPSVRCDADKISQVLSNLLSNAVKFSDHGRILLWTEIADGAVRFAVRDQGPGIHSQDISKLFQGFTQLPNPSGKKREGTGLGLAIAHQIIELHGGNLEVESHVGSGSTFSFTLPVAESASLARPAALRRVLSR